MVTKKNGMYLLLSNELKTRLMKYTMQQKVNGNKDKNSYSKVASRALEEYFEKHYKEE